MERRNGTADWDRRIARARALSEEHPSARQALTFYGALAEYQRSLYVDVGDAGASTFVDAVDVAPDFAGAVDVARAVAAVPDFLVWLERTAPAPLSRTALTLGGERIDWRLLLRECLQRRGADEGDESAPDEATAFVVEAVLQPYAEAAAIHWRGTRDRDSNRSHTLGPRCPVCCGAPCVGTLREEGQGAKRMLLCGRCLTEWEYLRVVCPGCGEERFDSLPVYTADAWPYVRIDACDTCRTYLKTFDLTRNGLAVALVDDIASVALDLWAAEHGYRRLRPNLLRTSQPAPHPRVA